MNPKLNELKARLLEVYDLSMAAAVLRWDQATYMPSGGAEARGRQIAIFGRLRTRLVPVVQAIAVTSLADDRCLRQRAPEDRQLAFGLEVIRQFGYDFDRGRQDKTHHPFMTKFSLGDVRITTRVREDHL